MALTGCPVMYFHSGPPMHLLSGLDIRNKNTRMAYYRAACSFFAWLEQRGALLHGSAVWAH
jgi:hypothetical protein